MRFVCHGHCPYSVCEDSIIHVERDNTDAEVIRELLELGITKDYIILAYNTLPFQKLENLIMA